MKKRTLAEIIFAKSAEFSFCKNMLVAACIAATGMNLAHGAVYHSEQSYFPHGGANKSAIIKYIIQHNKNLKRIVLRTGDDYCTLNTKDFQDVLEYCGKVESFDLSGPEVTDAVLGTIKTCCENLNDLSLGSTSVTTAALETFLVENGNKLKELDVHGTNVTNSVLGTIGKCCSNLKFLDIAGSTDMTIDGLKAFLLGNCNNLEVLNIGYNKQVNDDWLDLIGKKYPNVKDLYLTNTKVTNKGLEGIRDNCENIEFVDLSFCDNVTEDVLTVISGFKNLKAVSLYGIKVTKEGIEKLEKNRPNLEISGVHGLDLPNN